MPTPSSRRQPNFSWETDMTIEVKMPALSPTMEKGTLAKGLVSAGDMVRAGDLIAEIETDKAMMELEADEEGRIARLLVPEGTDDVAVGNVIAVLSSEDEAADGPDAPEPQPIIRPQPAPETVAGSDPPAAVMARERREDTNDIQSN